MTNRISSNGKALFNRVLPSKADAPQGRHVAALWENHELSPHLHFLKKHAAELVSEHNLGTVSFEMRPYMMLFVWAHKDGKITDEQLEQAFTGSAEEQFDETARVQAQLIAHLNKHHPDVHIIGHDARGLLSRNLRDVSSYLNDRYGRERTQSLPPNKQAYVEMLRQAKAIYDANPDYAHKLDGIESYIKLLRNVEPKLPTDTISALVATELADKDRNMIAISGRSHLSGFSVSAKDVQGIFDDAVAARGWKVSDLFIGDADAFRSEVTYKLQRPGENGAMCKSYDKVDSVYLFDRDQVLRFPREGKPKSLDVIDRLADDIFFCTRSKTAERIFGKEKLNPAEHIAGVKPIIETLHKVLRGEQTLSPDDVPNPPSIYDNPCGPKSCHPLFR